MKDESFFNILLQYSHQLLETFVGQYGRKALKNVIMNTIGSETQQLARLISSYISKIVVKGASNITQQSINELLCAFSWMKDNNSFEKLYLEGVVQRAFTGKMKYIDADLLIAESIADSFPSIAERAKLILRDFKKNRILSEEFLSNSKPLLDLIHLNNVKFTILPKVQFVETSKVPSMLFPDQFTKLSGAFTNFFRERLGNANLMWHYGLSRCTLRCNNFNNITKIKCDGVVASILLQVENDMPLNDLAKKLEVDQTYLEKILLQLKEKGFGSIFTEIKPNIKLNLEMKNSPKCLYVPTLSEQQPAIAGMDEKPFHASYESQIDAAIIRALKGNSYKSQTDLISIVQTTLEVPISKDLFQRRIRSLIAKHYLEQDGNRFKYIP